MTNNNDIFDALRKYIESPDHSREAEVAHLDLAIAVRDADGMTNRLAQMLIATTDALENDDTTMIDVLFMSFPTLPMFDRN